MTTKFWEIKAAKNDEAELLLYGDIGDMGFWGESVSAKSFRDQLKEVGNVKTLNIRINSYGGSVFDGLAITNALRAHKATKNIFVDGVAASIASVIAVGAGGKVTMGAGSFLMIHNPWGAAFGEAKDFRKAAETLDKIKGELVSIYAKASGEDAEHLGGLMDAETWFTADEAVAIGLADKVSEESLAAAAGARMAASGIVMEKTYKNTPKELCRSVQLKARLDAVLRKGA